MKGEIRSKEIGDWTQKNLGYSQLIMGVFIGLWVKLLYRKSNYNLYEILILLSYILGESFIILGFFIPLAVIFNSSVIAIIGSLIYLIYIIWGIGQFHGEKKIKSYIKAILAYSLGNISIFANASIISLFFKICIN